jgi:hypothetical protein
LLLKTTFARARRRLTSWQVRLQRMHGVQQAASRGARDVVSRCSKQAVWPWQAISGHHRALLRHRVLTAVPVQILRWLAARP